MLKWETNQHVASLLAGCALLFNRKGYFGAEEKERCKPPQDSWGLFLVISKLDTDTGRKLVALGMEPQDDYVGITFTTHDATIAYKASWLATVIEFRINGDEGFHRGIYKGKIVEEFSKFEFPKLLSEELMYDSTW